MAIKVPITRQGYRCQVCGHEWVPQAKRKKKRTEMALRCPNRACRSRRWDATKYPNLAYHAAPEQQEAIA